MFKGEDKLHNQPIEPWIKRPHFADIFNCILVKNRNRHYDKNIIFIKILAEVIS